MREGKKMQESEKGEKRMRESEGERNWRGERATGKLRKIKRDKEGKGYLRHIIRVLF